MFRRTISNVVLSLVYRIQRWPNVKSILDPHLCLLGFFMSVEVSVIHRCMQVGERL